VGNIQVATENHRLFLFQPPHEFQEFLIPFVLAIIQAGQLPLGVGCVNRHHKIFGKFGRQHTAFGIVIRQPNPRKHM